jgi:hypothetical protein
MFTSNIKSVIKSGLLVATLFGVNAGVQANVLSVGEISNSIERNLSAQAQEMLQVARSELLLSLQTQLADAAYLIGEEAGTEQEEQATVTEMTRVAKQ